MELALYLMELPEGLRIIPLLIPSVLKFSKFLSKITFKYRSLTDNLVYGVWTDGTMRAYYKRDCILEENMFKDGVLENPNVSNTKIASF